MISKRLHHHYDKKHLSSKNKDEDLVYSVSVMKTLTYCLDILKIKENTEFHRNDFEFMRKVPVETVKNEWITVMEVIAGVCSDNGHAFSQSGLSDFLTLATKKGINENRMRRGEVEIVNDVIFKLYRDIMEGYQNFNQCLKSVVQELSLILFLLSTEDGC
ncbi:MAG TPA: hypothetical protein VFJ05_04170 [Nitrososphaeraceae archaeon]|nr:hypothetical protein [Nitrososphaeraceae archaeon]